MVLNKKEFGREKRDLWRDCAIKIEAAVMWVGYPRLIFCCNVWFGWVG